MAFGKHRFLALAFLVLALSFTVRSQNIVRFNAGVAPVKAVSFNLGDKTLPFDTEFRGADDWFKGLSVNIENSSGKAVTFISVTEDFLRPKGQEAQGMFRSEFWTGDRTAAWQQRDSGFYLESSAGTDAAPKLAIVRPSNIERDYADNRASLDKIGFPPKIDAINVQIEDVVFKDGTMWSSGRWYKLDPLGTGGLVNIDKDGKVIPLVVVKKMQEDSPLYINGIQVDSSAGKFHLIDYSVQNVSLKNIKAYVIAEDKGETLTTFLPQFFVPGQLTLEQVRNEDSNLHDGSTIAMSVDFVLFEDGSSWGKDTAGKSAQVLGYFEGLTAATIKASELLVVADENVLETALNAESGEKAPSKIPPKESDLWKRGYSMGYRNAFSRLKSAYESQGKEGVDKRLREARKTRRKKAVK